MVARQVLASVSKYWRGFPVCKCLAILTKTFNCWERGAEVFDELLLDADWALNSGNWMWLSASCFFYQYFRCYSPVAFPKKYDADGKFVKHYLPILCKFPPKYIYEPWKAPINIQKEAGCIIGVDYPKPIVDHDLASKENMARMKVAYDAHKALAAGSDDATSKDLIQAGGKRAVSKETELQFPGNKKTLRTK